MGIKLLTYQHEKRGSRLPFTTDPEDLAADSMYEKIGKDVTLKSIGIDGSMFIHAFIVSSQEDNNDKKKKKDKEQTEEQENQEEIEPEKKIIVNIDMSANAIAYKMVDYINHTLSFFKAFGDVATHPIIIHIVVDSNPPVKKNRPENKKNTLYSCMSAQDRSDLYRLTLNNVRGLLERKPNLKILSNFMEEERREGEIELYSLCQAINQKHQGDHSIRNVIISSDTDVVAMMVFNRDKTLVIMTNVKSRLYILNYEVMRLGLFMTDDQLLRYTLLHFLLFGSDYNLGLLPYPSEARQRLIGSAVRDGVKNVNTVCCMIMRKARNKKRPDQKLLKLRNDLLLEGLCAALYYSSVGNRSYLTKHSPLLYINEPKVRRTIPRLSFW